MYSQMRFRTQVSRCKMGVRITSEQDGLEKEHGSRPNRWAPPKPWENLFTNQRLDLKEKKSANENRNRHHHNMGSHGRITRFFDCRIRVD